MHLIIVTAQINFHVMSEVCCAYELLASYCFPSTGEFCGLFFFLSPQNSYTEAHACNFSHSGDRDRENHGLRPTKAKM
jgi:hypothetical protein